MGRWSFFLLQNFDNQNKMQLFVKFKKILYMGFRATFKVQYTQTQIQPEQNNFFNEHN